MLELLKSFCADVRGGPLSEYALVAAILALAMIATMELIQHESANQLVGTQNRLVNTQLSLPTPTHT